jgi:hypothetical protein
MTTTMMIDGSNFTRLAYYRKTMLADMGIIPGKHGSGVGDQFISHMFSWTAYVTFHLNSCFVLISDIMNLP